MSTIIGAALEALNVGEDVISELTSKTGREDIANHLHAIASSVVDLAKNVLAQQHGTTPAVVTLAQQIIDAEKQLAILQADQSNYPGTPRAIASAGQIPQVQAQIAALSASASAAHATPPDDTALTSKIKQLVASATPTPAAQPDQQQPPEGTSQSS